MCVHVLQCDVLQLHPLLAGVVIGIDPYVHILKQPHDAPFEDSEHAPEQEATH